MSKYKVVSGEFEVIVHERTLLKAGDLAIKLHNESNHPSSLGELTLVEKLDKSSRPTGSHAFFGTQRLIDNNTSGVGKEYGQYTKLAE